MPGSKKAKTPADNNRSSAGVSAVDRIDLADALEIGTPELEALPITYKGIDLDLCRYYTADDVEALVDNGDSLRDVSLKLAAMEDDDEARALLQRTVSDAVDNIVGLMFPDQGEQSAALIAKLDERSAGETARIFRKMYQEAGIVNTLGEFLAH